MKQICQVSTNQQKTSIIIFNTTFLLHSPEEKHVEWRSYTEKENLKSEMSTEIERVGPMQSQIHATLNSHASIRKKQIYSSMQDSPDY